MDYNEKIREIREYDFISEELKGQLIELIMKTQDIHNIHQIREEGMDHLVRARWEARDLVLRLKGVAEVYDKKKEEFRGYAERMQKIMRRIGEEGIKSLSRDLEEIEPSISAAVEKLEAIVSALAEQRRA